MGGCFSSPDKKYETSQEVTDLKAQVDQLQKALAAANAEKANAPAVTPAPARAPAPAAATAKADAGVVDTLFFPDAKLPCRNAKKPGGCKRPNCEYAHDATALTRFLDYLGSAKRTVDICVFTITNDLISDLVIDMHKAGVKVRIITDNDQAHTTGSDIARFREEGIEVRQDATPAHMHHKYAIIDGELLMNGSFNWTRQAVLQNNENVIVLKDPALIKKFQEQFDKLWAMFKP